MSAGNEAFQRKLQALAIRLVPGADRIDALRRLSAGATLETWSFDVLGTDETVGMILRRSPGGLRAESSLPLSTEAEVVKAVRAAGVPAAEVRWTLTPEDELGDGFLMTRIAGETIPRKILRDDEYAAVRPTLARRFGAIAAELHRVDVGRLPALQVRDAGWTLDAAQDRYRRLDHPRPVFDLAIRWLRERLPEPAAQPCLVHGDFRNGNMIVGADGVRAVLDWEGAHLGDPMEDLAWFRLPPWRFGEFDRPAGGLGSRAELFDGYASVSGQVVDAERVRFWEVMGSLRWGVGCAGMLDWFQSGRDPSVERAMIARRASENELDLLRAISGRD